MADPVSLIEAGLISAALSTATSFAVSALTKPDTSPPPVRYPPNEIMRGGYLPLVLGRRVVGCQVGWVGDRAAFAGPSSGGTSLGGGGGKSQNLYLEGGWHQLAHGPVRYLHRIWQSGKVMWHTRLDRTTTANGSTFQTGTANNPAKTGDNFAIYFGTEDQPASPYLSRKAGLVSAYPGLCHVLWHRKLLGGSPSWSLMKYEIETVPTDVMAAAGLPDVFAAAGVPSYFDETTPATSAERSVTVWYNGRQSVPAGTYRITYVGGAFKLDPSGGWVTYPTKAPNFAMEIVTDGGTAITRVPDKTYVTTTLTSPIAYGDLYMHVASATGIAVGQWVRVDNEAFRVMSVAGTAIGISKALVAHAAGAGVYASTGGGGGGGGYATQDEAEAAAAGSTLTFAWSGGPMGIRFRDVIDHPSAVPGTPNPTYRVQLDGVPTSPSYTLSVAVQGGASGSGDAGWNPAAAVYVLLCAPAPYGCAIPAEQVDLDALVTGAGATFAAERLAVNVLAENGQAADEVVAGVMLDAGMYLVQVGDKLTPYVIRAEATAMAVPDDLIDGPLPEVQRRVSMFVGDRYTYQIDDVLADFATSDITVDNDAQAFQNNRPQAQTVKLATVTSRAVAHRVAVRRTAEMVADTHKVPSFSLHREARNPAVFPGMPFIMGGERYRITAKKVDTVGLKAEIDAALDQYGDVSITFDSTDDGGSCAVPPSAPPAPDIVFTPIILPRSEWPSTDTGYFGVPRVRASDAVNGAAVWISADPAGPYTQVGNQDTAQAGGVLLSSFSASPGTIGTGPAISPYNDDIEDVPDLSGDDASYNAGELVLVVDEEIMLLRSVTAQSDGSWTLDGITRGAFSTTVAAHNTGSPAIIVSREDLVPLTSSLLAGAQGGTLWIKTQPTDGQTSVDLSLVDPQPLLVPLNLLATITVTAPTAGTYYVGQPITVGWRSTQLTGSLDLAYSTDGGTTWTAIASSVADTGTYSWATAGLGPAASVLVRVASHVTPTVYDVSYPIALATAVAPAAPTGLTAVGGNTVVFLAWTAPTGSPAAQQYQIYRSVPGGPSELLATLVAPAGGVIPTSYTDAGLTNGTNYCYQVTAVANGAESTAAGPACATPVASTGGGGGGGTMPPVAATRFMWVDASAITGASNGDLITGIADAGGNGNTLSQSDATRRPAYHDDGGNINGLPYVAFERSNDMLTNGPSASGPNWCAFLVFRPRSVDGGNHRVATCDNHNWLIGVRGSYIAAFADGFTSETLAAATAGDVYCATYRYNGSISFRINGTDYTQDSGSGHTPPEVIALGVGSYSESANADVAEAIWYDGSVTDAERTSVEAYLMDKWGIGT